jgi:hypothetical protein
VRRALLAAVVAAAVLLAGCGAGTPVDQRRAVGSVHALAISGGVKVTVVRAPAPSVTVHAGRAVIDRVVTEARDGVLRIDARHGIVIGPDPLGDARVRVALPRLDDVRLHGGSDVDLGDLEADSLTLRVSGHGDVKAAGRVGHLDAEVSGPGDARLAGLTARTGRVAVHGPGDADVHVTDALSIEVHGPGDVSYRGNPRVTQEVSGPGDVTRIAP